MKRIGTTAVILSALALSACAPGPNAVAPASVPPGTYSSLSCKQATAEHAHLTSEIDALSRKQQSAATGDAIGVFLIAVPVSSLTGNDVQGDLAVAKGKKIALDARLSSCG